MSDLEGKNVETPELWRPSHSWMMPFKAWSKWMCSWAKRLSPQVAHVTASSYACCYLLLHVIVWNHWWFCMVDWFGFPVNPWSIVHQSFQWIVRTVCVSLPRIAYASAITACATGGFVGYKIQIHGDEQDVFFNIVSDFLQVCLGESQKKRWWSQLSLLSSSAWCSSP